jgi:periplasmic protein TonB
MTTKQHGSSPRAERQSAHMTIRPEGEGADVRTLFDSHDAQVSKTRVLSGVVVHIAAIALLFLVAKLIPDQVYNAVIPDRLAEDIVWLSAPGPGGGGGGGNKQPDPPKPAELKGQEKISVPVKPEPVPTPKPAEPPPLVEPQLTLPALEMAAANLNDLGAPGPPSTSSDSRGSGTGTGVGPGTGSGLGPGSGGGTGGGPMRPGNGVTLPVVLFEKKPQYTAEAMRAKVQGTVLLECVVLPDGTVGPVEVVRSLDSSFGLDQEAVKAAKQWRFKPGMRQGEPVAVLVTIELTFTLR